METVAFSTPNNLEVLDSGQKGDLQNTLLNTIKIYLAFRRKQEGRTAQKHVKCSDVEEEDVCCQLCFRDRHRLLK